MLTTYLPFPADYDWSDDAENFIEVEDETGFIIEYEIEQEYATTHLATFVTEKLLENFKECC